MQRLGEVCSMSKLENKEEKKEELDRAQQGAVDIRINAVVSAGAGSGKTKVLSKRFTDLLLKDKTCKVEQILTLTFTKKATVEMTGRIYGELSKTCPDKAKDFYKANIKTLDSYCSMVARQGSRFYGISPDFTIDDELIKRKINSLALPFILKNRDNAAIKALVATKDFAEIASQLFVNTIFEASSVLLQLSRNSTNLFRRNGLIPVKLLKISFRWFETDLLLMKEIKANTFRQWKKFLPQNMKKFL